MLLQAADACLMSLDDENLMINAFGSTEEKIQTLDLVNVKIQSLCGKGYLVIEVYSVPNICAPISNQTINLAVDKYPMLKHMCLADRNKDR